MTPQALRTILFGVILAALFVPYAGQYRVPGLLVIAAIVLFDLWRQAQKAQLAVAASNDDDRRRRPMTTPGGNVGPSADEIAARRLPPNALELPTGQRIEVVGESRRREAFEAFFGPSGEGGVRVTVRAQLAHERSNPYDPNAVAVYLDGQMVGYVAREAAGILAPVLDEVESAGRLAFVRAVVRGGWDRGGGDTGDYGMTLDVGTPDEIRERLRSLPI